MAEEKQKKPGVRGKDRKPRKTDGYGANGRKTIAKARKSNPIAIAQDEAKVPNEYNAKYLSFLAEITPTEPLDKTDVAEMERRFQHYLQVCAERGMKVSNQAAYLAIGINKDDVYDWTTRSSIMPERSEFCKKVQQICAVVREGLMSDGKVNPVVGIFWQKNYDGLRDQQEHIIAPVNPLGEGRSAEELQKKYSDAAYIDVDAEEQKTLTDDKKNATDSD